MMYVTIAETRTRIRIDNYDEDTDLTSMIEQASEIVANYLNADATTYADSNGDQDAPDAVKVATLMMVAELYKNREGDEGSYKGGVLPSPVRAILGYLRDPAMA